MENLEIKTENITENSILLYVKEEIENEDLNINDVKKEELLKIKKEVKDETECELVDGQYESMFMPEVYESGVVKTPFFNFDLYKRRRRLSNEGDKINRPENLGSNKHKNEQIENENINNVYVPVCNNSLSLDSNRESRNRKMVRSLNLNGNKTNLYTTTSSRNSTCHKYKDICGEDDCNQYNYMNVNMLQKENDFAQFNTELSIITKVNKGVNSVTNNRLWQDGQIIGQTEHSNGNGYVYQKDSFNIDSYIVDVSREVQFCRRAFLNRASDTKRCKLVDDSIYKCPLCKRLRVFDTLLAVHNHLKFEHLSTFSNEQGKLITKINFTKMKD